MSLGVIATLNIAEGKNAEFESIATQLAAKVNELEDGCTFYAFNKCRENPQTYIVMEQYTNQAAFDLHGKTEYFRILGKDMAACMTAPPNIQFLDGI